MRFTIETEAEEDGRWIAEIVELPGVMQYGGSRDEAIARAEALAHARSTWTFRAQARTIQYVGRRR